MFCFMNIYSDFELNENVRFTIIYCNFQKRSSRGVQ